MKKTITTFMSIALSVLAIGYFLYSVGWKAVDGVSTQTQTTITNGSNLQSGTASGTAP